VADRADHLGSQSSKFALIHCAAVLASDPGVRLMSRFFTATASGGILAARA
jgi:hypothetical protein